MTIRTSFLSITVFIVFLLSANIAAADIFWEMEQVLSGIPGQKDKTKTIRHYFTQTALRQEIGENVTIANFETLTGYVLNTKDKMFLVIDMNNVGETDPGLSSGIKAKATNEYKKIRGYKCRKYKVTFMQRTYEQWLSKDVDGYRELKEIDAFLSGLVHRHPLFQMSVLGKMDKLDGFPVQTVMRFPGGAKKTVTLKKVKKKPINKKFFKVPKGYKPPY